MLALHLAGNFEQLASFDPKAEAREPGQQFLERILTDADSDDFVRMSTFGERDIKQGLFGEQAAQRRAEGSRGGRIAAKQSGQEGNNLPLFFVGDLGRIANDVQS